MEAYVLIVTNLRSATPDLQAALQARSLFQEVHTTTGPYHLIAKAAGDDLAGLCGQIDLEMRRYEEEILRYVICLIWS